MRIGLARDAKISLRINGQTIDSFVIFSAEIRAIEKLRTLGREFGDVAIPKTKCRSAAIVRLEGIIGGGQIRGMSFASNNDISILAQCDSIRGIISYAAKIGEEEQAALRIKLCNKSVRKTAAVEA